MLNKLRRIITRAPKKPFCPAIPVGQRVYAVGDVHGQFDLLRSLIQRIEMDDAVRPPAQTTIVMLGDLIDHGPNSSGVVDLVIELSKRLTVRTLSGDREEMLLASLDCEDMFRQFLESGGRETLVSYFKDIDAYCQLSFSDLFSQAQSIIPEAHLVFLRSLENLLLIGDYLFVHAGIRPGIALSEQSTSDLHGIRRGFLDSTTDFGVMVVHGHTISKNVDVQANRIGIDTGAYLNGKLTAMGLEGTERWILISDT